MANAWGLRSCGLHRRSSTRSSNILFGRILVDACTQNKQQDVCFAHQVGTTQAPARWSLWLNTPGLQVLEVLSSHWQGRAVCPTRMWLDDVHLSQSQAMLEPVLLGTYLAPYTESRTDFVCEPHG